MRLAIFGTAVALLLVPAAAGATAPARGVTYVGEFTSGGSISFGVSRDGRRVFAVRVRGVGGSCMGQPSTIVFNTGPIRIRRGGFSESIVGSISTSISGGFRKSGRARGRAGYFDRGDCQGRGAWKARALPRAPAGHERMFTIAGGGNAGARTGRPATDLRLAVGGVAALDDGSVLLTDPGIDARGPNAIRRLGPDGRISTVAGARESGSRGDGGPAVDALLSAPADVAAFPGGGFLIADRGNHCVRRVDVAGVIATVAGVCGEEGGGGFTGDGGPATAARLNFPSAVASIPTGGFLVADEGNNRIRRVNPDGTIATVAGDGTAGLAGDGGLATSARLNRPADVAVLPDGGFVIADSDNNRIRRVDAGGLINTAAGRGGSGYGVGGFAGDGASAALALLDTPSGVAAAPGGGFFIADVGSGRVRRVDADGTISTVAGGGELFGGVRPLEADEAPTRVEPSPFGLLISSAGRLRLLAAPPSVRLLVALTGPLDKAALLRLAGSVALRARPRRRPVVTLDVTASARVVLEAHRRGRVVARTGRDVSAGRSTLRLPRPLPRGTYALRARAADAERVATTHARLIVR